MEKEYDEADLTHRISSVNWKKADEKTFVFRLDAIYCSIAYFIAGPFSHRLTGQAYG
jgi:hypothetical protein